MSVSTTKFIGWTRRKGEPWNATADGDSECMTWRRLLELPDLGEAVVLPIGRRPDGKPSKSSVPTLFTEDGPYARTTK